MTMTTTMAPKHPLMTNAKQPDVKPVQNGASVVNKTLGQMTEAEILNDASIEARSLDHADVLQVDIINTQNYYRWVNKNSASSGLYNQRRYQGFTNATPEDVRVPAVPDALRDDGTIQVGDLILMKLPLAKAYGAIKSNILKAQAATSRFQQEQEVTQAVNKMNAPADARAKVSINTPTKEELERAEASVLATAVGQKQ